MYFRSTFNVELACTYFEHSRESFHLPSSLHHVEKPITKNLFISGIIFIDFRNNFFVNVK